MKTNTDWDAALKTYLGRRALVDLDNELGDIAETRRQFESNPRCQTASTRHSRAQRDHNVRFKTPLVEAVADLLAAPAPDLEAVAIKRKAAGRSAKVHPALMANAFDLIAADIERLTGVAMIAPDQRAAA